MSVRYEETIHFLNRKGEVMEALCLWELRGGVKVYVVQRGKAKKCQCVKEEKDVGAIVSSVLSDDGTREAG